MGVTKMGEACPAVSYQNTAIPPGMYASQDCYCEKKWFALKVRTGGEPSAAAVLSMRGFEVYSPIRQERRRYSDRMKVVNIAMFPGYLFCRFDVDNKLPVISSPGVEYIVGFSGAPTPISENEMSGICRLIATGADVTPTIEPGRKVRVTHGPLEGVEGVVLRNSKGSRLVVSIELLKRSAVLHINEDELFFAG
jgi:transcription antitermination factor NusG